MLLGQAPTDSFAPWFNSAAHGGAVIMLGWALWHMLTKQLPAEREERRETSQAFMRRLDTLEETLRMLSSNCAATRERIISQREDEG
jgi:hypothetical protein